MQAEAHEFWLDPVDFAPKAGARVPMVQRNGINFLGDSYPYERAMAKRFTVQDVRGERAIKAVEGDDPMAEVHVPNAGLAIVAFQRAPDIVTYTSVAQLLVTLDDEGLDALAAQYRAMPNPPATVRESYARYAKTLLKVGAGTGDDRVIGLTMEIVVEGNPYLLAKDAAIVARVLFQGKPAADTQIKVFNRTDPQSPRRIRSDAEGRISVAGIPPGEVLLSAVVMLPGDPNARDAKLRADWVSHWASLTFKRP